MSKRLLLIGGVMNGFFTLFHLWLGWQIQILPDLLLDYKVLMQMLNVGVVLVIAFATFASFFCIRDLLTTSLGKATLALIALFYATRAAEEIILSPAFSPLIFGLCALVAIVYVLAMAGIWREPVVA